MSKIAIYSYLDMIDKLLCKFVSFNKTIYQIFSWKVVLKFRIFHILIIKIMFNNHPHLKFVQRQSPVPKLFNYFPKHFCKLCESSLTTSGIFKLLRYCLQVILVCQKPLQPFELTFFFLTADSGQSSLNLLGCSFDSCNYIQMG